MTSINYKGVYHHHQNRILVQFIKNTAWDTRMKKVPGVKWSKTLNGWTIPDTPENRNKCGLLQKNTATIKQAPAQTQTSKTALSFISNNNNQQLQQFLQLLVLKAYSQSTIRTYRTELGQLFRALGSFPAQNLQPRQLRRYLLYCIKQGLSENGVHSRMNAIKFYYEQVLHREKFFFEIPRPKRPLQLPQVLNKEEIACIIKAIKNVKHKTMIMLAYGCGLRVSEITALNVTDIDGKRRLLLIRKGKGKKDRVISLSPALLVMLREYYRQYKPVKFLFEGFKAGERYSVRSLEAIIQSAKVKAGIKKEGSMHMLRHSFATHLLDKGTDVVMIQKLLGHNDIKTTLRYLHVTNKDLLNILSPIEDIKGLL